MLEKNKEIETDKRKNLKQALKIINAIISSRKLGNFNTNSLAFLLDCEAKISNINSGCYTAEDISFLEEMIKETLKIFNAAKQEIKLIKENNKQIKNE